MENAKKLGREFVIQVTGKVIERVSKNPNIPTGEIEILVEKLTVLNESQLLLSPLKTKRMVVKN
jgi:aspartyl-tRNA synthetase